MESTIVTSKSGDPAVRKKLLSYVYAQNGELETNLLLPTISVNIEGINKKLIFDNPNKN